MPSNKSKKFSPNKKFYVENVWSHLHVFSRDNGAKPYLLELDRYGFPKPLIFRWSQDSQAIGMILGKLNERWVAVWFPFKTEFYTFHIPDQMELVLDGYEVDSIEVLADERTVICSAKGKVVKKVEMLKEPTPMPLTAWQIEKQGLDSVEIEQPKPDKKDWTWNHDQYGYEGVHLYEGQVMWYQHSHDPHAGGAAREQSFDDFLQNGPCCSLPTEFLKELYDAVKILASQKN